MFRRLALLQFALFFLILFGCRISGTLTKDGTGVEGITMVLGGDVEMTAVTDSDGYYVFDSVQKGTYTVTIEQIPGFTGTLREDVEKEKHLTDVTDINFILESVTKRETTTGEIIGYKEDNPSHVWLGIPYAKPPTGDLRWKAPLWADSWQGTYLALDTGERCTQFGGVLSEETSNEGEPESIGSEDCLFLNIWAPAFAPDDVPKDDNRLPVMLWIHGGGNSIGSGGGYNGKVLAEKYNLILVTFNYRLGPFGWFTHPALKGDHTTPEDQSGNYGTLDIIHALSWVRENIENFGGNPDNITVFGESAGALNTLLMMISPKAKGLFHKAIVQSGGIWTSIVAEGEHYLDDDVPGHAFSSREVINRLLMADDLAVNREGAKTYQNQMSDQDIAAYLYSKSSSDLLKVYESGYGGMISMPKIFSDGVVLPQKNALEVFRSSEHNKVPVIIGSNRDEQKLFMILDENFVEPVFGLPIRIKDKIYYELYASYLSDAWKATGVDEIASVLSDVQNEGVYAYRFDWDEEPTILGIDVGFMVGAAHSIEIPFVFCEFSDFLGPEFDPLIFTDANYPGRKALADTMSSFWAEFAYTGNPGTGRDQAEIEWTPWDNTTPVSDKFIILDTQEDGGPRMSGATISLEAIKYRLLADSSFSNQEQYCDMYVQLFADTDLWDDVEYENLGSEGCGNK